jgi:hypothetical protein
MITAMNTAAIALAIPRSNPRTLAVRTMARRFMAGPEKRKAVAGPIPAPFFFYSCEHGQYSTATTANIIPDAGCYAIA